MADEKDYGYRTGDNETITEEFEENTSSDSAAKTESANVDTTNSTNANATETKVSNESANADTTKNANANNSTDANADNATQQVGDWKTAIKGIDKYDLMKEAGLDDFTIEMLKYKDRTGDYTPYLEVKTVDYTKMTPEQLIRLDLEKKNKGMNEKAFNILLRKELENYHLDREAFPEDSDEAILGQELLRIKSDDIRKELIENQSKFKAPEPQPDLEATQRDAELQQQRASLGNAVMNSDVTKNLQTAKTLTYGEGEDSFKYPVANIQQIIDTAMNTILSSGRKDLNGIDLNAFYKQLVYGSDTKAFEKAQAEHYMAIAKKKLQMELGNVSQPNQQNQDRHEEELTPAQQLRRNGTIA